MPLVAHSGLPTFSELAQQGHELLPLDRAIHQDIRELHIGFLNMMPDAALQATERQFIRLVGSCNRIVQFYVYPFSLPEIDRGAQTRAHIAEHYRSFRELADEGMDALIITGANVANPDLAEEPFWGPLVEVAQWAEENVTSTLCSCLATHALLKLHHGIDRRPLPAKRWGVYSHKVTAPEHPLLREVNTRFDAPHSRHNDISRAQLEDAGLAVLAESEAGGVHLAASPDQLRFIYFQGHPEYDASSLWKEYKREAFRFAAGERDRPPLPENYLENGARRLARQLPDVASNPVRVAEIEAAVEPLLDNTWGDTAKAMFNNWLGLVYRFTDLDRRRPFMPDIDPKDPLGMLAGTRNQRHFP